MLGGLPPLDPVLFLTKRKRIKSGTVQRCMLIFLLIFSLKISLWTGFSHAGWIEIKGNYGFCFAFNGPCNWNLLVKRMVNTAVWPVSSVECHVSLLPNAIYGIFFQLQSKVFFFVCFKCWAPRIRIKISWSFERGNAKLRSPSKILAHPRSCSFEKTKASRGERRSWEHIPGI